MNREESKTIVHNALISYVDDCAGRETEEAKQLGEAWNNILEPEITPEEAEHMMTVLNHLDIDSELYDTQMKVMRGLGIKI